jgi:hypothetical protein
LENSEAPEAVIWKIQQKHSDGFLLKGQLVNARTGIGIAMLPEDGGCPDALIKPSGADVVCRLTHSCRKSSPGMKKLHCILWDSYRL